jgi:parallel beta-helix repeat protein
MKVLLLLAVLTSASTFAFTQNQDLGDRIAKQDAALGAAPGQIYVPASGVVSEGPVTLSSGHDLVCAQGATISLTPGSFLDQRSHTKIVNCTIAATSTPIRGEIQSTGTTDLTLDHVTFVGGGNLVYWDNVKGFSITDTAVNSITSYDPANNAVYLGIYLLNCSSGTVERLSSPGFVFPKAGNISAVLGLFLCHDILIKDSNITHVDASYIYGGSLLQVSGSSRITITGGSLTHSPNCDGITTQSYGHRPSTDLTITDIDASSDGELGQNAAAPLGMGDGIDLINTRHVRVSNCTCLNSGYLGNQQPAIWVFLDDDVVIENSDLSDSSMGGIDIDGSPNVQLINNTINRNQASGLLAEWQAGTATNVGTAVSFVDGVSGGFGLSWSPGTTFTFDGVAYQIASVSDSTHLTLTTVPPDHVSPANWGVESSNLQIIGGTINDNGLGKFGGQVQVGMSWADSTTGTITGVTSIDTGAGTQLFALELANTATAYLSGNTFSPNILGGNGVSATPPVTSPSTLSFANQVVGSSSSAQPLTFTAGAVGIENFSVRATGDYTQTNNCPSTLPGYESCQILVSFQPMAYGARTGTLTISGNSMSAPQAVSLAGNGVIAGLALRVADGTLNSVSVETGNTARYTLSIGGSGIAGVASLSCGGLPAGMSCNLPASQSMSATQATLFAVNVLTKPPSAGVLRSRSEHKPWLWAMSLFGFGMLLIPTPRACSRLSRWMSLILLTSTLFCYSCGTSHQPVPGRATQPSRTPTSTYTFSVTATAGAIVEKQVLTVTVE